MPLSGPQLEIAQDPHRFKVVIAGRRFGKTFLSLRQLAYHARKPSQEVWYVAPSYKMAKQILWRQLKSRMIELRWADKINETELSIRLKNASTITLKGAENYDSLRGVGIDYLVMDEFADINPDAFYEVLRPTLADRQGHAMFIGTPKGMNWAKDLYDLAEVLPEEWRSWQFTTLDGGNVKPEEIEAARQTMDERTFRQEFLASWETYSGRCYYAFDRKQNVRMFEGQIPREIHIGIDFNVDPITAAVFVKLANNRLHLIDELRIFGSNTHELAQEILERYPKEQHSIVCYPDPAGAQRKTSAGGQTDHTILRTAGFRVVAPHSHNAIKDGINAVNAKLCSSTGIIGLYVDPRCKYSIECFEKYTYKEGTSQPDKSSGFDHLADAIRYAIDYLAPIHMPAKDLPIRTWSHKIGSVGPQNSFRKM